MVTYLPDIRGVRFTVAFWVGGEGGSSPGGGGSLPVRCESRRHPATAPAWTARHTTPAGSTTLLKTRGAVQVRQCVVIFMCLAACPPAFRGDTWPTPYKTPTIDILKGCLDSLVWKGAAAKSPHRLHATCQFKLTFGRRARSVRLSDYCVTQRKAYGPL